MCGEECPNKNEMAAMRLRMNVRENKFQQLNADLIVSRQELEAASETANKFRLENSRLEERIKFVTDENERLANSFKELLELRQKLAAVIRVCDFMRIY
jgi:predicted nuclease with TOPRIM domain